MDTIKRLQPDRVFPFPGIKAAVRVGDLLFVSGQVPLSPKGELVGADDFRAQAAQVFANLGAALEAGGSGFDRIAKVTVFFTDIARDLAAYREVRDRYIPAEHATASSAVQVKLLRPDFLIEVDAVAYCGILSPIGPKSARDGASLLE
jgi:2-iminobutanoate/2-iminopropanoate deaminase